MKGTVKYAKSGRKMAKLALDSSQNDTSVVLSVILRQDWS